MITKLKQWGNSQAIRIPKEIIEKASLAEGDSVDIILDENNSIIIKPLDKIRKITLDELFKNYKGEQPEEVDWGKPEGKEVW